MNLLYYLKKITFISIILCILYGVGGIIIDIVFSPSPCSYGFGDAFYQSRIKYIRDTLKINVPQSGAEILKFKCDGFQDPFIEMSLIVTKQQTKTLINDFKKTYSAPLEQQEQNTLYENIDACSYAKNISYYEGDSYPIRLGNWDFLDISLNKHENDSCIINLTVGDM